MRRALTAVTAVAAVIALSGGNASAERIGCGTPAWRLARAPVFRAADADDPAFTGAVQAGRQVLGVYVTRTESRLRAVAPGAAAPVELSKARVEAAAVASAAGCGLVAWQPAAGGAVQVAGIDRRGRWHLPIAVISAP